MKGSNVLFWGALVGGGTLALAAFGRRAQASTRAPETPRPGPEPLHGLGGLSSAPVGPSSTPPPADPATQLVMPVPTGSRRPGTAPLPSWNRRTDDGGPPLFLPDEVEALARVITSEAGNGPLGERMALAWIARNRARARRPAISIARLVCSPCGESSGNARPFSTRMPATPQNRELAALILASPQSEDPTQGATSCFEPGLQDRLHAAGKPGHKLDARGIRYCWLRSGLDYYGSVGRWDLFGAKGGRGARPVPRAWNLDGYSVCCYRETRAACRGKQPGDRLEG
jgi:hypothetical protein